MHLLQLIVFHLQQSAHIITGTFSLAILFSIFHSSLSFILKHFNLPVTEFADSEVDVILSQDQLYSIKNIKIKNITKYMPIF